MIDMTDEMVDGQMSDEPAFAALMERHRRELHVHCYRMLGNFEEAEDAVQETFLRAWRSRESFRGGPLLRAWLYRIATNACLDALRRSSRRVPSLRSFAEVPWLQPYPDLLLDEVAPSARATLRDQLPERPSERPAQDLSEDERRLLDGFIATHESGDAVAAAALMREDIRVTMPPHPFLYEGRDAIAPLEHPWHDRSAPGSTVADETRVPTRGGMRSSP